MGKDKNGFIKCLALGAVFILIALYFYIFHLYLGTKRYYAFKDAISVPVENIISLDLRSSENSYTTDVVYEFKYKGVLYSSSKKSIYESSSLDSVEKALYDRLKHAKEHKLKVNCYILKEKPMDSVLNKDLDIGLTVFMTLFPTTFFGLGCYLINYGRRKDNK